MNLFIPRARFRVRGIFYSPADAAQTAEVCRLPRFKGNPFVLRWLPVPGGGIQGKAAQSFFELALRVARARLDMYENAAQLPGRVPVVLSRACGGRLRCGRREEHGGYPARYMLLDSSSRNSQSLSTPVAAYVNDEGAEVALIGAIHVAEADYYARLNKLFGSYDVLLFEMIGGEGLRREEELRRKIDRNKPMGGLTLEEAREWNRMVEWRKRCGLEEKSFLLGLLGSAYRELSAALGLQTQHQGIDYSAPHFIHADMTLEEFRQAQASKGENFASLMLKSILSSLVEKPGAYQPNEFGMMVDLLAGNKAGLKNELMRILPMLRMIWRNTVILRRPEFQVHGSV